MAKPVVAITMGDPAGIGPEVVLKALTDPRVWKACHPLVVGDLGVLERTREKKNHPELVPWERAKPLSARAGVPVYPLTCLSALESRPGHPSRACGEASYRYICGAVELVLAGEADAIATAPISKKALQLAGHPYPGHTEILAELTRTRDCRMMFVGKQLKIVLVTVHLRVAQVAAELTRRRVLTTLELAHQALREYFGLSHPKLAVAALNPHGGEDGIFGDEEKRIIFPAINDARARGIAAFGPLPPDSLFCQAVRGDYDAVISMYHDQGLIPLKLLEFFGAVQLTLGLPFIRTSVDHGTAYDIAGQSKANPTSMREAILLAAKLTREKRKGEK